MVSALGFIGPRSLLITILEVIGPCSLLITLFLIGY
jgi:hypothetical protein